jgi:hypothetical protein
MATMQASTKALWMWLKDEGGRYTAAEVAEHFEWHVDYAIACLYSMRRHKMIAVFSPLEGSRRQRYGVTGMCHVPQGLTVAEAQA